MIRERGGGFKKLCVLKKLGPCVIKKLGVYMCISIIIICKVILLKI
jgi:hypothetical protein